MVELCAVVTSHPEGAPRAFTISATTRDGTAGKAWHINSACACIDGSLNHTHYPCTAVAGDDYVPVSGENLVFASGETRVCHTIEIINDDICEHNPNEFFFSDLAYVSGMQPITIAPPTARVVIDDSGEPECKCNECCAYQYNWCGLLYIHDRERK